MCVCVFSDSHELSKIVDHSICDNIEQPGPHYLVRYNVTSTWFQDIDSSTCLWSQTHYVWAFLVNRQGAESKVLIADMNYQRNHSD